MGRDCVSHAAPPPSMAHSRSCGAPKCSSARRPRRSRASSWASSTQGCEPAPGLFDPFGSAARKRPDGHTLAPDPALKNLLGGAVDDEVVRVDRPGNHRLAEARAGVDDRFVPPSGHRVRGEQDPGHGRVHHPLDHHGERHRRGADPVRGAVAHGAVRPERGPALPDRSQDRVDAHDVQEGVLLAGEAGERQILGGRGRADRHGRVRAQRRVGGPDGVGNVGRDVRGADQPAGGGGQPGEPRQGRPGRSRRGRHGRRRARRTTWPAGRPAWSGRTRPEPAARTASVRRGWPPCRRRREAAPR